MNTLAIKDTAMLTARHFDQCMMPIWVALLELAPKMTDGQVVITSGSDSHDLGMHPQCRALDVRISNIEAESAADGKLTASGWRTKLRGRLGRHYDVVLEDDHIHIEYDPKGEL